MTTKIIITPANHGVKGTTIGGAHRTVRVVTVGGPQNANRAQHKTLMTVPLPGPVVKAVQAPRGEVRTVFKRVYTSESPSRLAMMSAPRKRQRLDHLTSDQKNQRRKLKNRVAAQTARDRKKMQMDLLESRVTSLERQNDELLQQNTFLQKQNDLLSQQNALLLQRLESPAAAVAVAPPTASVESAEGTGGGARPRGGGAAGAQPAQLGRLPGGAGHGSGQHVDLLDLLTETIFGSEEPPAGGEETAVAAVVGAAAEELESGDDTLMDSDDDTLMESADDTLIESDDGTLTEEALLQLLQPESPLQLLPDALTAELQESAVPESPRLSPEPPSLPPSPTDSLNLQLQLKPEFDDLVKIKAEMDLEQWPMFDDEPLDAQFDDQFLLFPQLVL